MTSVAARDYPQLRRKDECSTYLALTSFLPQLHAGVVTRYSSRGLDENEGGNELPIPLSGLKMGSYPFLIPHIGARAMAKSPRKPTNAKSTSKSVEQAREAIYAANQAAIDTALDQCVRHLKKLEIEVAHETIRRLEAYYLKHGTSGPGNIGRKFRPLI